MPFPGRPFARHISLICQEDLPPSIRGLIETSVRMATKQLVIDPMVARYPWLEEGFALLAAAKADGGLARRDDAEPVTSG